jgi:hypothetical protein
MIGRRRYQQIRVLLIPHEIARTGIGAAVTRSLWLRNRAARGLRVRQPNAR